MLIIFFKKSLSDSQVDEKFEPLLKRFSHLTEKDWPGVIPSCQFPPSTEEWGNQVRIHTVSCVQTSCPLLGGTPFTSAGNQCEGRFYSSGRRQPSVCRTGGPRGREGRERASGPGLTRF